MIARAPGSTMDPPEVEARSDTREIPLATIDERSPSANYAGSQDTSSDNTNISTRRSPVLPQANILTLEERTQRAREATTNVAPSSSSNIILEIISNISENISNPNVFQNRQATSSALTRNRTKHDMHQNLMSTTAIDTGTN